MNYTLAIDSVYVPYLYHDLNVIFEAIGNAHQVEQVCILLDVHRTTYYRYKWEPSRIPAGHIIQFYEIYKNLFLYGTIQGVVS